MTAPLSVAGFQRSIAVVIGINDYRNGIPRLATAVNDAQRLAQRLTDMHGYNVHLFVDDVTRPRLQSFFTQTLAQSITRADRLLLYFAGHGIALDGDDGPEGYLILQDAQAEERSTFLPMTELHGWLDALACRHLLLILDCCFAGAFRWASTRHLEALPDQLYQERYDHFIRTPAWQVLTSAAYDQRAADLLAGQAVGERGGSAIDGAYHSPFALALFTALDGAGDLIPKGQGDGVITAAELYLYLRQSVEGQIQRQTPGLWPLHKHDKGEYIFLVPGHSLNLPPAPALTAANNPYRGLKAYEAEQADLFFGRSALVEKLAATVQTQPLIEYFVRFSPDDSHFVDSTDEGSLWVVRVATGQQLSLGGGLRRVEFSPKGKFFRTWNEAFQTQFLRSADDTRLPVGNFTSVLYSPDESYFVVSYVTGGSNLWDGEKGVSLVELGPRIKHLQFDLARDWLIIAYEDGRAYILDLAWLTALRETDEPLSVDALIRFVCTQFSGRTIDTTIIHAYWENYVLQTCTSDHSLP